MAKKKLRPPAKRTLEQREKVASAYQRLFANQERVAFHNAIVKNPWDMAPRLVYADWLDEGNYPQSHNGPQAELIRLQAKLSAEIQSKGTELQRKIYASTPEAELSQISRDNNLDVADLERLQTLRRKVNSLNLFGYRHVPFLFDTWGGFPMNATFHTYRSLQEWLPLLRLHPLVEVLCDNFAPTYYATRQEPGGVERQVFYWYTNNYDYLKTTSHSAWLPAEIYWLLPAVQDGEVVQKRLVREELFPRNGIGPDPHNHNVVRFYFGFDDAQLALSMALVDYIRQGAKQPLLYQKFNPSPGVPDASQPAK